MYTILTVATLAVLGLGGVVFYQKKKQPTALNPSQYFDYVKSRKMKVTDKDLDRIYDNCLRLLNKYKTTGQTEAMKKLIFHIESIEKEHQVLQLGIDTYVHESDINNYIQNIANDVVKIIELKNYPREVPDDITEKVKASKDLFDEFYVVFTDYTGEVEAQVDEKRRDKDPILFGVFKEESLSSIIDRFYFIGDWEDEYCDLTLDKMVAQIEQSTGENIEYTIKDTKDIEALKEELNNPKRITSQ